MTAAELIKSLSTVTEGTASAVVKGIHLLREVFGNLSADTVEVGVYECNLTTTTITADITEVDVSADCINGVVSMDISKVELNADIKDEHGTI